MLQPLTAIQNYFPSLWNSIDDIDSFDIQDIYEGDLVQFEAFYERDSDGVGIIKEITEHEFINEDYDPSDPDSELFIMMPCAIVRSVMPDENWLDYVPLQNLDVITLTDIIEEYKYAFPNAQATALWTLRLRIAARLSQYRHNGEAGFGNLSDVSSDTNIVPVGAR